MHMVWVFLYYWSLEIHKCIRGVDEESEFCCALKSGSLFSQYS